MRICHSVLIVIFFFAASVSVAGIDIAKMTVYQARGLKQGKCYEEAVQIDCESDCNLSLFPLTRAQLTLKIEEMPEKARKEFGHFFLAEFRVLDQRSSRVTLLSWKPISIEIVRKRKLAGLVMGHSCLSLKYQTTQ